MTSRNLLSLDASRSVFGALAFRVHHPSAKPAGRPACLPTCLLAHRCVSKGHTMSTTAKTSASSTGLLLRLPLSSSHPYLFPYSSFCLLFAVGLLIESASWSQAKPGIHQLSWLRFVLSCRVRSAAVRRPRHSGEWAGGGKDTTAIISIDDDHGLSSQQQRQR